MKRFLCLFVAFGLFCVLFPGCAKEKGQLEEIQARGELRVGVKLDVPYFGYQNPQTGQVEGLEVDIARELANRILGNSSALKPLGVTALTRDALLSNGEIDMIIATFTITEPRKELMNFSQPYYTDQLGFMVDKDSGIEALVDLEGKTLGVTLNSTAYDQFSEKPEQVAHGIILKGYASYPEVRAALMAGEIDAFSTDKSILYGYLDENTVLLAEGVNSQPYGIATPLEDKVFSDYINTQLQEMKADGTLDQILERWLK